VSDFLCQNGKKKLDLPYKVDNVGNDDEYLVSGIGYLCKS